MKKRLVLILMAIVSVSMLISSFAHADDCTSASSQLNDEQRALVKELKVVIEGDQQVYDATQSKLGWIMRLPPAPEGTLKASRLKNLKETLSSLDRQRAKLDANKAKLAQMESQVSSGDNCY